MTQLYLSEVGARGRVYRRLQYVHVPRGAAEIFFQNRNNLTCSGANFSPDRLLTKMSRQEPQLARPRRDTKQFEARRPRERGEKAAQSSQFFWRSKLQLNLNRILIL